MNNHNYTKKVIYQIYIYRVVFISIAHITIIIYTYECLIYNIHINVMYSPYATIYSCPMHEKLDKNT